MATEPEVEVQPAPLRQRAAQAVKTPIEARHRPVTLLAISASLIALAPIPFGPLGAALLVVIASDRGRR